jgi:hypothetical protein
VHGGITDDAVELAQEVWLLDNEGIWGKETGNFGGDVFSKLV